LKNSPEYPEPNSSLPQLQLIGYRFVSLLGKGGMGEVYLAEDEKLKRRVAVKLVSQDVLRDEETHARFLREAQMMATVEHPNVVRIYSFGEMEHRPYLVMEYVEGESLANIIRKRGNLTLNEALMFLEQIVEALEAGWEKQVIHRDLKPSNILIDQRFRVRVADFGLAKAIEPAVDSSLTASGQIMGSPAYASPEQLLGKSMNFRSDIYSLGILFCEMLVGVRPHEGPTPAEVIAKQLQEQIPPLSEKRPELSPGVDRLIWWMTEKDITKRPPSYVQLLQRIRSLRNDSGNSNASVTATQIQTPVMAHPSRPQYIWWISLFLLFILGLVIGVFISKTRPKPPEEQTTTQMSYRYLTFSGQDSRPASSPDGRYIAFSSRRLSGIPRIWIKDVISGMEQQLTTGPDTAPRFSANGNFVLFTRATQIGTSIYRITAMGGESREIVADASEGDWSPDSKSIAFIRREIQNNNNVVSLMVVSEDGSRLTKVAQTVNNDYTVPRWSPDGKLIAVREAIEYGNLPAAIRIFSVDGKLQRTIQAPPDGDISNLFWSGIEGALGYILYDAPLDIRRSSGRLVLENEEGTRKEQPLFLLNTRFLDVLSRGSIVFEESVSISNIRQIGLDGKSSMWLTRGRSSDGQPVFSPDGESILFSSPRSGNLDLWKLSRKTGTLSRITESNSDDYDPAYSPDGQKILWSSSQGGRFQIWIAEANGSSPRLVTPGENDAENPSITPDNKWIVYGSYHPSNAGVWKIAAEGGDAIALYRGRADLPHVSPDGRFALFRVQAAKATFVRVVEVATSEIVPFEIRVDPYFRSGRARWMPDGKAIAFVGQDSSQITGVFVQDFKPGEDTTATRRKLPTFDPDLITETFDISADGKTMAVSYYKGDENLVIASGVPSVTHPFLKPSN
jgi:serine/threonine protein kinase